MSKFKKNIMDLFSSSPALLSSIIKTKIKQAFLSNIDTDYRVDEQWLEQVIDILIYTFNVKKMAGNEVIDLEDGDLIDECVKVIVIRICSLIEQGLSNNEK